MQVVTICMLAALTLALSCTAGRRELHVRSISPDGRLELSISWVQLPPDGRVTVTLHTQGQEIDIYRPLGDWIPGPVEVYWQQDRRSVAALVCNDIGSPLVFQYNLEEKRMASAISTRDQLRSNLTKRYSLSQKTLGTYQGDPIEWACRSAEAGARFRLIIGSKRDLPNLPKPLRLIPHE